MPSPADLFMENWELARKWSGPDVQNFKTPCAEFKRAVDESILIPSASDSYEALKNLQRGDDPSVLNGRIMHILAAIDDFFEIVHPRTLNRSKLFDRIPLSHWMRKVVLDRLDNGAFSSSPSHQLVPRGPLLRSPRGDFASSAYSFLDQFAFLTVVRSELLVDERPIRVSTLAKDRSLSQGLGLAPSSSGSEKVAFIPIAQLDEHLDVERSERNGHAYIDFKLSEDIDAAAVIDSVLCDIGYADIVMSAELMVDAHAADRLRPLIAAKPGRTRILLAGSGNTLDTRDGLPWNETRVFNGSGVELWRQRKIWQAGLDTARSEDLGLVPGSNGRLMEHNHAGDEVVVADLDGFGRCVVLICQDIKSSPLASQLIKLYQPDWVFVPILDWGTGIARWAHVEAFHLSDLSPARFLIASSLSMVEKLKKVEQPCGLAIGPKDSTEESPGRECATAYAKTSPHGFGMVEWQTGWGKSALKYEPKK
ncbi:hypothetical protein PHLH6_58660 [Pseudomonas sp. Seg1]|uniref:hypothetical protein n=1 Tax=Pseudomonas sp. Seg1 TaxID=2678259 RepID=UPI001BB3A84C|nr:hypothetical protein [Pseudomonas sp. Seg1]BBP73862.1 hypothetical protein PHLH6_58660 [Pseudomonas sp. Seg1]